jgi:hypothetical protein
VLVLSPLRVNALLARVRTLPLGVGEQTKEEK